MDGFSAEVPKSEPIGNRSELAERFVLEQKTSFYLSAQKRVDQTVHVLDSLAVPGKDISSDLPSLINQSGSPMPEVLPAQIAQLKEIKSTASLDSDTMAKLDQARQARDKSDDETFIQLMGGEDYFDAWRKFETLEDQANSIINLNTQAVSGYVVDTIDGVVADRSRFVDAISENEAVQDELFNHALGVVRPRLELLIEQGILPRQLADEYIHLVRTQHNTAKIEAQDPNIQQRAQRIKLLVDTIPALESVNKIITGIENRSYKQIFELLIKEKSGPILQQMKQEITGMDFEHTAKEYFDYLVHSKWAEVAPVSPWQMIHAIDEAKMLWEVVRTSPLGQAFSVKSWEYLEARMAPELYSEIARYQFVLSGRFTTFYDFLSITKENHQLRQPYLVRILNGLASEGDDKKVTPALYLFLKNLSTEDLTYLQQNGFPEALQLRRITETHPQTFYTHSFPDPENPHDWTKNTRNPIYEEVRRITAKIALKLLDDEDVEDRDRDRSEHNLFLSWISVHQDYGQSESLWQDAREHIPKEDTDWMLYVLRGRDRVLSHVDRRKRLPSQVVRQQFFHAVNSLKDIIHQPDIPADKRAFLISDPVLFLLARQPHKFDQVVEIILHDENFDRLTTLMTPDGPLAAGVEGVLHEIFSEGNPSEKITEILDGFSGKKPYWEALFDTCRNVHGEDIRSTDSGYPITWVPTREGIVDIAELIKRPTLLEQMVEDPSIIQQLTSGNIISIPLASFHGMYKEAIFREYLRQAVVFSQDAQRKQQADIRNREFASKPLTPQGIYLHATAIDIIEPLLMNGNLPKQVFTAGTLESYSKSFPFHADFIKFDQAEGNKSLKQLILSHERIGIYGASDPRTAGVLGEAGQIFLVYDRNNKSYEAEKDFEPKGGWQNHRIIPGGMPSTEISAIVLANHQATFAKALIAIVENGFYIPIFDFDGNLLLTPQAFDSFRKEKNLAVAVPVWEYSSKVGEKKGSHEPAGEYIVPFPDGSSKRFYVKFARFDFGGDPTAVHMEEEEKNRIWNEFLAEKIYRQLGIPVPETGIVKVNRTFGHAAEEKIADARAYAHASEMLAVDPEERIIIEQRLKNGFLADALLANWDITKAGNVVTSNGEVYRIDNGGALLFRARGERKTAAEFNTTVPELFSMRSSYLGLEDADIRDQLKLLRERFRDEDIDNLVDSVRLNQADRDLLKMTLKGRKDYILNYFAS